MGNSLVNLLIFCALAICALIAIAWIMRGPQVQLGPVNQPTGTPPPANAPANPTPAQVKRSWMQPPSRRTTLIVAAVLFCGVLLYKLYYYDWDPGYLWDVEPIWFYLIGAAVLAGVLWKVVSSAGNVSSTVTAYPKLFTVLGFVLLAYMLVLAFFPESRNFLTSGFGIALLVLCMLGYSAFVIIKTVFWKDSKITAFIMMAILIIILDVGITRNIPPERRAEIHTRLSEWWPFGNGGVVSATSSECNGNLSVLRYSPENLYDVNENGCQVRAYVMEGCVRWYDAGQLPIGGTCKGGPLPFGIRYMKPESMATVRLNHCRNNTPGILVDKCA